MQAINEEQTESVIPATALIQKAYDALKASDAGRAYGCLEEALRQDLANAEIKYALACVTWWRGRVARLDGFNEPYEKAAYLLSQWKAYYLFLEKSYGAETYDRCQYAVRRYVFSIALRYFEETMSDVSSRQDPVLLLQTGKCCKGVGNYEQALRYLEQSVRYKREDVEALSELADVNALLEETQAAKVLFREAFFLDPRKVDLRAMESEMIVRLRDYVAAKGYKGEEIAEWIPVYGALLGVFSVKREMRPAEFGRLKQSIFQLENDLRTNPAAGPTIKPRLLNRYFWLIDYCENMQADAALAENTRLKLKLIDESIYEQYVT